MEQSAVNNSKFGIRNSKLWKKNALHFSFCILHFCIPPPQAVRPPFRQGRLIFLIFYDNNRHDFVLNLCLCIKKNIVLSASLAYKDTLLLRSNVGDRRTPVEGYKPLPIRTHYCYAVTLGTKLCLVEGYRNLHKF